MPNKETGYDNKSIVLQELIGLKVRVKGSKDFQRVGLRGTVIDETKGTLTIKKGDSSIIVPKLGTVFVFYVGRKSYVVDGKEINFRPHERISKAFKFYKARNV
ncbi:MAG: ribonuclease P protein subunit [Candidatus Marsarchaeota archaeon]|nr:ribonuclease P protein subunit [Candidatus Marsarchaeota archaeon]MCL5101914.1 ribonuclease P protein subunit [Candidatus Marsarchaeota archaeon]